MDLKKPPLFCCFLLSARPHVVSERERSAGSRVWTLDEEDEEDYDENDGRQVEVDGSHNVDWSTLARELPSSFLYYS